MNLIKKKYAGILLHIKKASPLRELLTQKMGKLTIVMMMMGNL